jgi:hypothetical protein
MFQIYDVDIDHEKVFQLCLDYSNNSKLDSSHTAHLKNLKTSSQILDNNEAPEHWLILQPLMNLIREKTGRNKVQYSWFNIMHKGSSVVPHAHNHLYDVKISCTYYPRLDADHNVIEFFIDGDWQRINVKQGQCIIFPGDLIHRVPVQQSDNPRCCVAINLF